MKWRTQDWYWLTGILISIIIFILAFRLSDNITFMNVFSFMASGVSIALAFVAMYTSFKQNSENQILTTHMSETLARMDEKINSVGDKVKELNMDEIRNIMNEHIRLTSKSIEETFSEEDDTIPKKETLALVNSELTNFAKTFEKNIINKYEIEKKLDDKIIKYFISNEDYRNFKTEELVLEILNYDSGKYYSFAEILIILNEKYNKTITASKLKQILRKLLIKGELVEKNDSDESRIKIKYKLASK